MLRERNRDVAGLRLGGGVEGHAGARCVENHIGNFVAQIKRVDRRAPCAAAGDAQRDGIARINDTRAGDFHANRSGGVIGRRGAELPHTGLRASFALPAKTQRVFASGEVEVGVLELHAACRRIRKRVGRRRAPEPVNQRAIDKKIARPFRGNASDEKFMPPRF